MSFDLKSSCALALLLFGCAASEDRSCDVDVSGYERGVWKPPEPTESTDFSGGAGPLTWSEELSFPGTPQTQTVVWWPESGDVRMRYTWAVGSSRRAFQDVRLVAFVDGVQIQIVDEADEDVWFVPVSIGPGETRSYELSLREGVVPAGAHTMALVLLDPESGNAYSGAVLTAIAGNAVFARGRDDAASCRAIKRRDFTVSLVPVGEHEGPGTGARRKQACRNGAEVARRRVHGGSSGPFHTVERGKPISDRVWILLEVTSCRLLRGAPRPPVLRRARSEGLVAA